MGAFKSFVYISCMSDGRYWHTYCTGRRKENLDNLVEGYFILFVENNKEAPRYSLVGMTQEDILNNVNDPYSGIEAHCRESEQWERISGTTPPLKSPRSARVIGKGTYAVSGAGERNVVLTPINLETDKELLAQICQRAR